MLIWVEHEKNFIISGPDVSYYHYNDTKWRKVRLVTALQKVSLVT